MNKKKVLIALLILIPTLTVSGHFLLKSYLPVYKCGNTFYIDVEKTKGEGQDILSRLTDATATPRKGENGIVNGFIITQIKEKSLLRSLGMSDQDIILNLNGTPIGSMMGFAMEVNHAIQNKSKVVLTIERNSEQQQFVFNLR